MRGAVGVVLLALVGCVQTNTIQCEVGTAFERLCPSDSTCDDVHHLCVTVEQRDVCAAAADGTACVFETTAGFCRDQICLEKGCGDGFIDAAADEECEGENFGSAVDCTSIGFYEASPLKCSDTCTFDRSACLGFCGDGVFTSSNEECDGDNLGGATDCRDLGYYEASPLTCDLGCAYDESACLGFCGDGLVTPSVEFCDGAPPDETCTSLGFFAGFLDCAFCAPDLGGCKFVGWHEPQTLPRTMMDIDGSSDTDVYAVSHSRTLLRFDGDAWIPVDISTCLSNDQATLSSVRVVGPSDVIVAGYEAGGLFIVRVTGTTCTKSVVDIGAGPVLAPVTDMWASSADDVWLVTFSDVYRFNGVTWSKTAATGLSFNEYVWAAGPNVAYVASASALRRWNGATWDSVTLPFTNPALQIRALYGTSATDVYVGGGTNTSYIQVMRYNGTWSAIAPPEQLVGRVLSLSKGNGSLFAATEAGPVYTYDGAAWTAISGSGLAQEPRVYASPSGQAYVIDRQASQANHFSGNHRSQQEDPAGESLRVFAFRSNAVYAAAFFTFYGWDGISWLPESRMGGINDVWVDSSGLVYTVEGGGLYRRNGYNTYQLLDSTAVGSRIWGFSGTDIWIVSGTTMKHYVGAGAAAGCATCTGTQQPRDIWGSSPTNIFTVASNGEIRRYNGTSWTTETSNTTRILNAVWGWAPDGVVAVGAGTVLHYNGSTWQSLNYPHQHGLNDVWATGLDDIFVSSADGWIYHYDGAHWAPVNSGARPNIGALVGAGDSVYWFGGSPATIHRLVRTVDW